MRILTKYIVKEFFSPFFFGVFAFSSMLLGAALINLLGQAQWLHLSYWAVLKILTLMIPENIMYGMAMSSLLATLLGLGNLTSHSETIAMRAGGFTYNQIAYTIIIIGFLISLVGVSLNEYIIPTSYRAQERLKYQYIDNSETLVINNFYRVFTENNISKAVFAGRYDASIRKLENLVVLEIEQGKLKRTIQASEVIWKKGAWVFGRVKLYEYAANNFYPIEIAKAKFNYQLGLTPQEVQLSQEPPERKGISELKQYIDKFVVDPNEKRRLLVELNIKMALPFASLIFTLLGVPLALKPTRRSNGTGFGLCMIFILLYYLIFAFGSQLGRSGIISPVLGAWSADLLLLGYGFYVFVKMKN